MTAALGLRNQRWTREQLELAVVKPKLVLGTRGDTGLGYVAGLRSLGIVLEDAQALHGQKLEVKQPVSKLR